jgi:hypothetical protein
MNHDAAAPGTDGIETQAAHVGAEFEPDHDCEYCSPPPAVMPPPQRHSASENIGVPQADADDPLGWIMA